MKPLVIGLLGGVASGKSTVAQLLVELGAERLDADEVAHEALREPQVKERVVASFGNEVLNDKGEIERKKLGQKVFDKSDQLKKLTEITHPWIADEIRQRLGNLLKRNDLKAICLDVSLLLESGRYEDVTDLLVFVNADDEARKTRASHDRGWSEGEVSVREKHQVALKDKKARANVIIDNNAGTDALASQVSDFWKKYVEK